MCRTEGNRGQRQRNLPAGLSLYRLGQEGSRVVLSSGTGGHEEFMELVFPPMISYYIIKSITVWKKNPREHREAGVVSIDKAPPRLPRFLETHGRAPLSTGF